MVQEHSDKCLVHADFGHTGTRRDEDMEAAKGIDVWGGAERSGAGTTNAKTDKDRPLLFATRILTQ